MKRAVRMAMENGAGGVKVTCAGRLGGAEMKRTVWYRKGRVPLHTLNADIEFGQTEAVCTYGKIGVKVWIFHKIVIAGSGKNLGVDFIKELSNKVKDTNVIS